jgi:hypothetical protein
MCMRYFMQCSICSEYYRYVVNQLCQSLDRLISLQRSKSGRLYHFSFPTTTPADKHHLLHPARCTVRLAISAKVIVISARRKG